MFEQTSETCYIRELLPEHFVSLLCQSDSGPHTFGEAAAANKTFNTEFLKQIKAHAGKNKDCYISGCTVHKAGDKRS